MGSKNLHHDRVAVMKNRMIKPLFSVVFSFTLGFILSCSDSPRKPANVLVNPVDPQSPVFTKPKTTLQLPFIDSSTIEVASFYINIFREKDVRAYAYKLDNDEWTDWDTSSILLVEDLDEGPHNVKVKAQHIDRKTEEENPPSFHFRINAVKDNSVMFSARKKKVSRQTSFDYYIVAEEVEKLYGAQLVFTFDPSLVNVKSVIAGSLAKIGTYNPQLFAQVRSNSVRIEMFLSGNAPVQGMTGSDTIVVLKCETKNITGTALFTFKTDSVRFVDPANTPISISQKIGGKVVVR